MRIIQELMFVGVNKYDFQNEKGETIRGVKVDVISPDIRKTEDAYGYEAVVMSAPFDLFFELNKLVLLKTYFFNLDVKITKKGTKATIIGVTEKKPSNI